MRWPVFVVAAFAVFVAQLSLCNMLSLHALRGISPNIMAVLAVFVALFANRAAALWGCWTLGLLLDLAPSADGREFYVIGPNALGFAAGGYLVLQLRTMVFRRRALTIGFLTLLALVASSLVAVMILAVRSWYPQAEGFAPLRELTTHCMIAVYSGVVAVPLGWLLNKTLPMWGFQSRIAGY